MSGIFSSFYTPEITSKAGVVTGGKLTGASGAAAAGAFQAAGSIFSAYMASRTAKRQMEAEKKKHNADTRLNVAQFDLNQTRLAGLAGVASGQEQFARDQDKLALGAKYGITDPYALPAAGIEAINTVKGKDGLTWEERTTQAITDGKINQNTTAEAYRNSTYNKAGLDAAAGVTKNFVGKGDYKLLKPEINSYLVQ